MRQIADRLIGLTERAMALGLLVMVVLIFANVVLRYVFNSGYAGAEEIGRLMFVWVIFLGAIVAQYHRGHLSVVMVQSRLPAPVRRLCAIISHGAMLYGVWLFGSGSWVQVLIGMQQVAPVTGYSMAFMPLAGLVAALGLAVLLGINLIRLLINSPEADIPGANETLAPGAAETFAKDA